MIICIDPGHGGIDSGAVGRFSKEKDINLAIALKLADELHKQGLKTILTRKTDVLLGKNTNESLSIRCKIANNSKADYFISIHCNSSVNKSAKGIETYCYSFDGFAYKIALSVQKWLISLTGAANRGVKTANYYVLKHTKMPAILIECGFISNPDEEKKLNDKNYQDLIVKAIVEGFKEIIKGV